MIPDMDDMSKNCPARLLQPNDILKLWNTRDNSHNEQCSDVMVHETAKALTHLGWNVKRYGKQLLIFAEFHSNGEIPFGDH